MENIVIREISKIGDDHKQCEDSTFHCMRSHYDYNYYFLATFDGCSTGKDSHFASNLMKKIMRQTINNLYFDKVSHPNLEFLASNILNSMFVKLKEIKFSLDLPIEELLSTIVFGIVKKYSKDRSLFSFNKDEYLVLLSGDGCYQVNDDFVSIDQNNQPDYIAYHLHENFAKIWETFHIQYHAKDIKNFAVMSDGILSFKKENNSDTKIPIQKLLKEENIIKSEAMLPRICNILAKEGYSHYDDLSIVRLISLTE